MYDTAGRRPPPPGGARPLFWRLFAINGLVFTVGTLVLAVSPATVSSPVLLTEVPVLTVGLAVILAANGILLRRSLAPLDALTRVMQRVDLLRSRDRLADPGNSDLAQLIETFNAMLDRLEAERSASSAHALAAQEGERQRIARELHDEIGQSLTAVLLGLKRAADRAPTDLRAELHDLQEGVRGSLDDVRQVARRLRPDVLEDLGLLSALNALATEYSQATGATVSRDFAADLPELTGEAELVLYRVAQECLTNAARHARADNVRITLRADDGTVTLTVADDGVGGIRHEGAGIRGMREPALLISAELSIIEPDSGGTAVRLELPVGTGQASTERAALDE